MLALQEANRLLGLPLHMGRAEVEALPNPVMQFLALLPRWDQEIAEANRGKSDR